MKRRRLSGIFIKIGLMLMILLVSCSSGLGEEDEEKQGPNEQLAQQALISFLDDMHSGRYQEAVQRYGGSYQALIENNSNIEPSNYAGLLETACQINGYQCLEVKTTILEKSVSDTEYTFEVEFINEDGTRFTRGPCCGGNATDFPPESSFRFTVTRDSNGNFMVMDLPPYVP